MGQCPIGAALECEPQGEILLQFESHSLEVFEIAFASALQAPLLKIFQRLVVVIDQLLDLSEVTLCRLLKRWSGCPLHFSLSLFQFSIVCRLLTLEGIQRDAQFFLLLLLCLALSPELALQAGTTGTRAQAQSRVYKPMPLFGLTQWWPGLRGGLRINDVNLRVVIFNHAEPVFADLCIGLSIQLVQGCGIALQGFQCRVG
ncbi:hypothetical protein D3C85_1083150 [compost metagenome]